MSSLADATPQYLRMHLLGVGELSRGFSSKLHMQLAGELIGLLHDLGEYSAQFQVYIGSALGRAYSRSPAPIGAGVD